MKEITLDLGYIESDLSLTINERASNTLFVVEDAAEHGEAPYQLIEGCFYDFELSNPAFYLADPYDNVIQAHKRVSHIGRIAPNIYVGTLEIQIYRKAQIIFFFIHMMTKTPGNYGE